MKTTWSYLLPVLLLVAAMALESTATRHANRGGKYRVFGAGHRSLAKEGEAKSSGRSISTGFFNRVKGQMQASTCAPVTEAPVTYTFPYYDNSAPLLATTIAPPVVPLPAGAPTVVPPPAPEAAVTVAVPPVPPPPPTIPPPPPPPPPTIPPPPAPAARRITYYVGGFDREYDGNDDNNSDNEEEDDDDDSGSSRQFEVGHRWYPVVDQSLVSAEYSAADDTAVHANDVNAANGVSQKRSDVELAAQGWQSNLPRQWRRISGRRIRRYSVNV